jgi:hypothetical protein
MDILQAAQGGQLIATVAAATNIGEDQTRAAMAVLAGDIARRIARLAPDSDKYDDLLDILDDDDHDEYLDQPKEMLSRDAIKDGEDILKACYGSVQKAHDAAQKLDRPEGLSGDTFARLMTLTATLTLSAMSRQSKIVQFGVADTSGEAAPERGFIVTMFSALVTGFIEGFRQAMTRKPRRRRKRSTLSEIFGQSHSRRRSKRTRKRRSKTPSLNDLLGDLLKG